MDKIRIPIQQRSIDKKQSIIDAAFTLFKTKGLDQTNTKKITRQAGVSVGTFYSYFEDKEDVLLEIVRQHKQQQIENPISDLLKEGTGEADFKNIHQIVKTIVSYENLPLHIQRHVSGLRYTHPKFEKFHQQEEEVTVSLLYNLIRTFQGKTTVTDMDTTAKMLLLLVKESLRAYSVFKQDLGREVFIHELAVIIYNYLFCPHPL